MTTTAEANAYLRTKVLTAPPEQLRLMLLDGAIRFARQAAEGMVAKDYEATYNGITQSRAIVLELATSIRPDADPELAERVRSVYMFLYREMVDASLNRNLERLNKAIGLLEYERETWALLLEKVAAERAAGKAAPVARESAEPVRFSAQG
ncbi:MAG: flagellar protein FliS [Phycisphaerales bacterium]|nr:flagellar protein FliS [Phycisphaerales bacterium]